MSIYSPSTGGQLRQCELLSELIQVHVDLPTLGTPDLKVLPKKHPFALILTQDCDLEQDFNARTTSKAMDKVLPNILFCEVVPVTELKVRSGMDSQIYRRFTQNKDERYQFLQAAAQAEDALGLGIPPLGIDFKRYFTIPADELYTRINNGEARRRCVLQSPYMEQVSTRFSYFLMRVALPEEHQIP